MIDLIETPSVEAYAAMRQQERVAAAQILARNKQTIDAGNDALRAAERAALRTKRQMIVRAKAEARAAAQAEVANIYADEFRAERILAFETHPRTPEPHGDIKACSQESYEWDVLHSTRRTRP
jgi:hypothetical protein